MKIKYIAGINYDRIAIINNNNTVQVEYCLGVDSSLNRTNARYAHEDVVNAKKYGWKSSYVEKPYIGDLLPEGWENLEWFGVNVFAGRDLTAEEITEMKNIIHKGNEVK